MKLQFIKLLIASLCLFFIPISSHAQNLTGTWRLKEFNKLKGADYADAIPLTMKIEQKPNLITIERTNSLGDRDTVIKETLNYGEKVKNQSITKTGRKKTVSFEKTDEGSAWLKQTEIFQKEDTGKVQSLNKETFRLRPDGVVLSLLREYVNHEDPKGNNENFIVDATYEKLTPEQLAKETATGKGVNFIEGLNWKQIMAKAKAENKYIFVDCYATWCGACKMIDKYVYPLNIIGEAVNENFIAVKVQMDSIKTDPANIKLLYPLARKLETDYNINALPTYLFFSPEGKIVHKGTGKLDAKDLIKLLAKAKDSSQQMYTLFESAKQQKMPWSGYPILAKRLKEEFGEKELAIEVAGIYNSKYLNALSEEKLLTKANLDFIGEYIPIVKSSDQIFNLCLKKPALVDTIKEYHGGGWAEYVVNRTVNREEIIPVLQVAEKSKKEPDWEKLDVNLTKKYNKELATTYVLGERIAWYAKTENWTAYLKYLKPYLSRLDLNKINPTYLHWCAWYVFKYSDDPPLIKDALDWIDLLIAKWDKTSVWMVTETKACMLYKSGKRDEGIALMKKTIQMFPEVKESYQPHLDSMIKGQKIWLTFK